MPTTDKENVQFLYAIVRQLEVKHVDWHRIAWECQITNSHAARMRFHRLRQFYEGRTPQKRQRRQQSPNSRAQDKIRAMFTGREDGMMDVEEMIDCKKPLKMESLPFLAIGKVKGEVKENIKLEGVKNEKIKCEDGEGIEDPEYERDALVRHRKQKWGVKTEVKNEDSGVKNEDSGVKIEPSVRDDDLPTMEKKFANPVDLTESCSSGVIKLESNLGDQTHSSEASVASISTTCPAMATDNNLLSSKIMATNVPDSIPIERHASVMEIDLIDDLPKTGGNGLFSSESPSNNDFIFQSNHNANSTTPAQSNIFSPHTMTTSLGSISTSLNSSAPATSPIVPPCPTVSTRSPSLAKTATNLKTQSPCSPKSFPLSPLSKTLSPSCHSSTPSYSAPFPYLRSISTPTSGTHPLIAFSNPFAPVHPFNVQAPQSPSTPTTGMSSPTTFCGLSQPMNAYPPGSMSMPNSTPPARFQSSASPHSSAPSTSAPGPYLPPFPHCQNHPAGYSGKTPFPNIDQKQQQYEHEQGFGGASSSGRAVEGLNLSGDVGKGIHEEM